MNQRLAGFDYRMPSILQKNRGRENLAMSLGNSGRYCPEFKCPYQRGYEADGLTPLFLGQENRTSVVIAIIIRT
jgi:hypothetical protein